MEILLFFSKLRSKLNIASVVEVIVLEEVEISKQQHQHQDEFVSSCYDHNNMPKNMAIKSRLVMRAHLNTPPPFLNPT